MVGVHFYLEYDSPVLKHQDSKNHGYVFHSGNVIAVLENGTFWSERYNEQGKRIPIACKDAISAVFFYPDSPVASTSVALDYLQENCKKISEKLARQIHPNLFKVLDESEDER